MVRTRSTDGAGTSNTEQATNGESREDRGLLGVLQGMLQQQAEQTALLRDGMLAAQQTAAIALERTVPAQQNRPGNVTDFRRLQPATFSGTGTPLEAEQWLVDVTNLLKAARIPAEDKVEVVKIQLVDVARTWWLAEEVRFQGPVSWELFSECFLGRFFPKTAKREMERRFVELTQGDRSVDAYAAEFVRLSRFAPSMVRDEEDRANRFQQGLRLDLQKMIACQSLETYAEVLTAARKVEMGISV